MNNASADSLKTWQPGERELKSAAILDLMKALGARDYDDFLRISTSQPERYWEMVTCQCDIVWDKPPQAYVDLSRGKEFPSWFPGARLN